MKYFGTDGIRRICDNKLYDLAFRAGFAFAEGGKTLLLAQDTRESGVSLASAFAGGAAKAGGKIRYLGVLPTPALAFLVQALGADGGAVITASHNPAQYNGIKLFDNEGCKPDESAVEGLEKAMDALPLEPQSAPLSTPKENDILPYYEDVKPLASPLRICVDLANGAAARTCRKVMEKAGINVEYIHEKGVINDRSGVLYPQALCKKVKEGRFDAGFAFDGDGDRLLMVNEKGEILDGNALFYALAVKEAESERRFDKAVCTVLMNKGVTDALKPLGVECVRVKVGDANVAKKMREIGATLGGEPSGHLFVNGYRADALKNALRVCEILCRKRDITRGLTLYPEYSGALPFEEESMKRVLEAAELWRAYLGKEGSITVRPSGTEPLLRIRVEAKSRFLADEIFKDLMKQGKNGK